MVSDEISGNVGIGTASPVANLHISSFGNGGLSSFGIIPTSAKAALQIDNLQSITTSGYTTLASSPLLQYSLLVNRISSQTVFPVSTTTNNQTDFVVDQYGNTGIGFAIPITRLDVFGLSTGGTDLFRVANEKVTAIYATVAGNVGVGTTTPGYPLDINGDAHVSGKAFVDNTLTIGSSTAASPNQGYILVNSIGVASGTSIMDWVGNASTEGIGVYNLSSGGISNVFSVMGNGNTQIGGDAFVSGTTNTTNFTMTSGANAGFILQGDANGKANWVNPTSLGTSLWAASGNNIYNVNTGNIGIGTNQPRATLDVQGFVRIGNISTAGTTGFDITNQFTGGGYSLFVQYGILTEKVKVALTGSGQWSDYVFDKTYKLRDLSEVEDYIKQNHHLQDVPSTDEVLCEGIDMAQMDAVLLKKIEELTLYVLDLKKENDYIKNWLRINKKFSN